MVIYVHRNLSSGSVPEQIVRTYLSVKDIVEYETLLKQYPSYNRSERLNQVSRSVKFCRTIFYPAGIVGSMHLAQHRLER